MGHRAAVYTVRVRRLHKRNNKYRLLGDIDEAGTYLGDVLKGYLEDEGFRIISGDGSKAVSCESCDLGGDELAAMLFHGMSGQTADIYDSDHEHQYRQIAEDTHEVRVGALFILPRDQEMGWLAVHVNNGRSAKGLLSTALNMKFREDYDDLTLAMAPYVEAATLREAIAQNRLDKVKLVKYEQPNDRAADATDRWVEAGVTGKLEVAISVKEKTKRLVPKLISDYLNGDASKLTEIVEFQGISFDEAKVEVELPGGGQHTFNLEKPEAGNSFSEDLKNLDVDDDGEPTAESIFGGLRQVLSRVT